MKCKYQLKEPTLTEIVTRAHRSLSPVLCSIPPKPCLRELCIKCHPKARATM